MILLIDNYDSFTFNLYQYLGEIAQVKVVRNDEITIDEIRKINPKGIVISPGPKTPKEAGISVEVVKKLGEEFPILGICLGHQSIGEAFGGKVVRAKEIFHGKTSQVLEMCIRDRSNIEYDIIQSKNEVKNASNIIRIYNEYNLKLRIDKLLSNILNISRREVKNNIKNGTISVSYTHLDVYKRQVYNYVFFYICRSFR